MSDRLTRQARESLAPVERALRGVPSPATALANSLAGVRADVSLADKYDLSKNRVFVSGAQAVVRTLLTQAALDRRAGLNTAGFVSGYRGSPLGRLDTSLASAARELTAAAVKFEPGLNEDLAATAVWGTQQAEMRGEGRYDGVFSLWYGKGPGVDRSCDALRHANLAGTSPRGGVIALMGDDHLAESSTTAHQSEFIFAEMMMPVLSPANVQEIVDYGILGFAMSRFTSTWTGIKCVKDTVESTASIDVDLERFSFATPADFQMPPGGLSIRARDLILAQDERLTRHKFAAILAFLRANRVNRVVLSGGSKARLGIITSGKAYLDVRHALDALGIDEVKANAFGLRLYKLGCPWPLEPHGLKAFASGLETIMVVEEKRGLIEQQLREQLYDMPGRPVCIGKADEAGAPLFPPYGALDANEVAIAIGRRLLRYAPNVELAARLERLERAQTRFARFEDLAARTPHFCSGCPHSGSTKIPEGARAYAGIGCHYMAQGMDRATEGYTHMGGEGANWIGEAPFSTRRHVFQNLGDGTYNHSGTLAIRFAVAAKTNITYKILFNDAVAMTGGQKLEGQLTVDRIAQQCAAEGVAAIAIVADDIAKYPRGLRWPAGTTLHARAELDSVQRRLAETDGVTILIFDQTCAAEKRRRRKRGLLPDPDVRVVINEAVCEGCGDCGVASNCVSLQPLETEFGRKRTIDQTACNKDLTCVTGFCPAIVTVKGAKIRKAAPAARDGLPALPPRPLPPPLGAQPFSIIVAGVGGTGVVTIAAILGMAAHIEGKGCGILDMAGLAQKGGNVVSYVKLAERPEDITALRVGASEADLILGCDLVAAAARRVVGTMRRDGTAVVVNTAPLFPGEFTRNPDYELPVQRLKRILAEAAGSGARFLDATDLATTLLGSSLASNMFLLGYAWQNGLVPLSEAALEEAIRLNGESVDMNLAAFAWGRRAAAFPDEVRGLISAARPTRRPFATKLEDIIALREETLTAYQNPALARRFRSLVERVRAAEKAYGDGSTRLTEAVARTYFKLLAVKDEYEVARLYTNGDFARQLDEAFEGDIAVSYHFASPFLARRDKDGRPRKRAFGPWVRPLLTVLAAGRVLRGSRLDPFFYTRERKIDRELAASYERLCEAICTNLAPERIDLAVELAELPQKVRGFGHVKEASYTAMKTREEQLLNLWQAEPQMMRLAAE